MNYKQLVESATPGEWNHCNYGKVTSEIVGDKEMHVAFFPIDNRMSQANVRLICHHKRHFERLVEALRGLNTAYNQGRMPTLEERTACRLALADADKVE